MVMSSLNSRSPAYPSCGKLNWNASCSDESEDEEQLSSLVRNSYMKHLKRCLSKNYEKWSKSNISVDELNFCSEMLEKKALRSCMVTSIYQRTMAKIVKEIKDATQNETLYDGFRNKLNKLNLFENVRCDKETQTLDKPLENKKEIINCNEEILLNNNSNSSFSNSKTLFLETFGETEAAINMKLEQEENGVDTYEELLNILLSSPKELELNTKQIINPLENSERDDKTNKSLCKKRKLLNGEQVTLIEKEISQNKLDINIGEMASEITTCPRVSSTIDENDPIKNYKFNSLLVNWSYELFVQNTHLENILSKLKPHKRVIIEKRFKDLFGNDTVTEQNKKGSNISEEELNLCRKRIARIIVGELTPFYVEGKIGSRPVFKNLAKKLTDDILCTTFTPDPESIRNTVRGLFVGGKQINSLKDAF